MIDRTLLSRCSVVMKGGRGARRRAEAFLPHVFRNSGKHGEIERKNTFAVTSVFSRTIHERISRSLLRKVFHERGTFAIYVRCYVVSSTFVARTWFTNAVTLGVSYEGLCSCFTFAVTYSVELNVSHGLRSPFNLHERGLGIEHGTNVELPTVPARNSDTILFYHSFYSSTVDGWMFFRISPWEGFTAKTHVTANVKHVRGIVLQIYHVTTARKARTWKRFTNVLRNNERGVMVYEAP